LLTAAQTATQTHLQRGGEASAQPHPAAAPLGPAGAPTARAARVDERRVAV
jgi:hypothetical protein